jgi:hypothetical protein
MRTDGGSLGAKHLAIQPGEGGSNPTPSLKFFRAHLVPRSDIKEFIEKWHYSGSVDGVNSTYCFDFRDPEGKLVGAMILGRPAAGAGRTKKYGDRVIEIRRLCCIDGTPKNCESRFIGYVLRWLRGNGFDAVLAYSDFEHGHEGGIYAASNFRRVGRIPGAVKIEWNGRSYHDRSLRKVEGRLKPFSRRLRAAVAAGETKVRKTAGKSVWVYRWDGMPTTSIPEPNIREYPNHRPIAKPRKRAVYLVRKEEHLMDERQYLAQLVKERDDLNTLITALQQRLGASHSAPKAKGAPKPHGSVWTPARRAAMSKKLKSVLAAKRKAAAARSKTHKAKAVKPAVKAQASA